MSAFTLVVRDEAQEEIEAIADWYDAQRPGLGQRFSDELENALKQLRTNPHHQVRKGVYRYGYITGFPHYRIVYTVDGETITVYQVRHTSRRPHLKYGP
ncbi:MAG: type II toxin-antitoxin system RelE/ParE family toxin [Flavobacteriales bacterium]|nr:type II toxin-antitoxin system RelE/ParE family toxin [Flavobacteriales bacterium]